MKWIKKIHDNALEMTLITIFEEAERGNKELFGTHSTRLSDWSRALRDNNSQSKTNLHFTIGFTVLLAADRAFIGLPHKRDRIAPCCCVKQCKIRNVLCQQESGICVTNVTETEDAARRKQRPWKRVVCLLSMFFICFPKLYFEPFSKNYGNTTIFWRGSWNIINESPT